MNENRLRDYLDHMQQAAMDACGFVGGLAKDDFHGYFDINLDVVWDTAQTALPELLKQLHAVRQDAENERP